MIWLIGMVLLLQSIFYWALKPAINLTTPIFELRGLIFFVLILLAWTLSGGINRQNPPS